MANEHQDIHDALGILPTDSPAAPHPEQVLSGVGELTGVNDLVRAVKSGKPENMLYAAGMLGLGALPGERAGKAASVTMNKLFPEATWLGASGLLHPQDYVNKLGGKDAFAKNFPASYAKIEPHLNENAFAALNKHYGPDSPSAKGISEEEIDKALAKNPGASIMDIAGTHVGGPSSPWEQQYQASLAAQKANKLMPSDFPREVPFGVPPKARELGFTQPAVHGTPDRWGWEGPMDQLKLPEDQLGVHFGDPGQAAHFSVPGGDYMRDTSDYPAATPRTYPAVLQMHNPLEMRDMGSWGHDAMIEGLNEINKGKMQNWAPGGGGKAISPQHAGLFPLKELDQLKHIGDVRDYIASKGFDSIKYINSVEGAGRPSYIMFQESPTDKGYVSGVRSPFAQFDPSKLHAASVAAGVGGIAAVPLLSRNSPPDEEAQ